MPSNSIPRYLMERTESLWLHKDLYTNVHNSFIKLPQTGSNLIAHQQVMDKLLYDGILLCNKKKWTTGVYKNMSKCQGLLNVRSQTEKECMLCDSTYIKF